jgi:hypothetical protein
MHPAALMPPLCRASLLSQTALPSQAHRTRLQLFLQWLRVLLQLQRRVLRLQQQPLVLLMQ